MSLQSVLAFGIGAVVAVVVLVGLTLSMREFIYLAQNPTLPRNVRLKRGLFGLIYFLGQIVVAVAVFFRVPLVKEEMLAVGLGLVATLLVSAFFMKTPEK